MKIIVVYHSYYGGTKRYAEWIAEGLGADCFPVKEVKASKLEEYDIIIFGGGLYAGGIAGLSFVKKNFPAFSGKKWFLFACGATPYSTAEEYEQIMQTVRSHGFTGGMERFPLYYFPSSYDFSQMSFGHKTMMRMMNRMMEQKEKRGETEEQWEKGLKPVIFKAFDHSNRDYILPLVEAVKALKS